LNTQSKEYDNSLLEKDRRAVNLDTTAHLLGVTKALQGEGSLLDEGSPAFGIAQIAEIIILNAQDVRKRSLMFVAGNGGSSSNASHLVLHLEDAGYTTMDLTSRAPLLTAYANDYGYEEALVRQSSTIRMGDVLIVISGSGDSKNLVSLVRKCKSTIPNVIVLGFLGSDGGELLNICDRYICIRSHDYGIIEDCHSVLIHILHKILMKDAGRSIRPA
jgi:D-sedoheptulose 7-phosphate isomerase